jgi:elongation factor G
VDSGDTVTDYLAQERERGITIQAAAVTFGWRNAKVNLIDTPGHVDFTVEVERSVRVLDGAVTVLDSAAGVEAQTETVWRQADRHRVPRLVFANKMDRDGASWDRVLLEIRTMLGAKALPIQLPLFNGSEFEGAIDLVNMKKLVWHTTKQSNDRSNAALTQLHLSGSVFDQIPLTVDDPHYTAAVEARDSLVQRLAELDDEILEQFLEAEDTATAEEPAALKISSDALRDALRRVTIAHRGVPVLCGSALRNIGVQPLMDAVVDYLPSPLDRPAPVGTLPDGTVVRIGGNTNEDTKISPDASRQALCALAFKVISDPQRGPMVFVRVYSGVLENRAVLFNTTTRTKERVNRLFQMYGDQVEPLSCISAGNIGVLVGLKNTRTGDTLVLEQEHRQRRQKSPQLDGVVIPPPVFFCAIEPESSADEKPLQEALACLLLEDPSLRVSQDPESGQTLLSGQGELHLEIIGERLRRDFRVRAEMGKVRISYRETAGTTAVASLNYDRELLGKRGRVTIAVRVEPIALDETTGRPIPPDDGDDGKPIQLNADGNAIRIDSTVLSLDETQTTSNTNDTSTNTLLSSEIVSAAIRDGIEAALTRGPLLGFPVAHVLVRVERIDLFGADSTVAALRACASQVVYEALTRAQPILLEPTMRVQIRVPEQYVGTVLGDLGSHARRGRILAMDDDQNMLHQNAELSPDNADHETLLPSRRLLHARVPLAGMLGYASALRSMTAGTGTFTMELEGYGTLSASQQQAVLKEMRGY